VYRTSDDADGNMVFAAGPEVWCGGVIDGGVCARCGRAA
jgi:hypothetical protein